MRDKNIFNKLKIKPGVIFGVVNKPGNILLEGAVPIYKNKFDATIKSFGAIMLFTRSADDINSLMLKVQSLSSDIILWISYPKQNGEIKSDLNRDNVCNELKKYGYKAVAQISLDTTWSTIRFKPFDKVESPEPHSNLIDPVKRIVKIPSDLKSAFRNNLNAFEFFKNLSFTHKKEYILWIESAKKSETREKRISATIQNLNERKKEKNNLR